MTLNVVTHGGGPEVRARPRSRALMYYTELWTPASLYLNDNARVWTHEPALCGSVCTPTPFVIVVT